MKPHDFDSPNFFSLTESKIFQILGHFHGDSLSWGFIVMGNQSNGDSLSWGLIIMGTHYHGDSLSWGIKVMGNQSNGESK